MRTLRLFLYGIPAALLVLLVAAFLNASILSVSKKNEMSIGTLGEPSTLNPIQQADSASSQVGGLIFNGLIKYNQNLEIVGDLATKWELSQETTFQFGSEDDTKKAGVILEPIATQSLVSEAFLRGKELVLRLKEPGFKLSEDLLQVLSKAGIHPLPFPRSKQAARSALSRPNPSSDSPFVMGCAGTTELLYLNGCGLHLPGDHEREGRLPAPL